MKTLLSRCGTICKFASSSLLSSALDYCLFLLFSAAAGAWAWGVLLGNIAARLVSACFNYSLNKYMVFRGGGQVSQDLPQYVLLAAGILTANSVLLHGLTALGLAAPAAKLITEMTLFAVSFSVQTLVIFRKRNP
ncbi:GtrA family protein [Oscillibacter valericigenes]|uniref:GtrA family protein n=1 Tax=Oscillibacter valericigenes TaxID=351091 RepID=UPI001FAF399C|nr:GtrA family protein [Oscillibacter valericigenes]